MIDLDVSNAMYELVNTFNPFYNVVENIDDRLCNFEKYLIDNDENLETIVDNTGTDVVFTIYSEAIRNAQTETLKLENIQLRTTLPFLNNLLILDKS